MSSLTLAPVQATTFTPIDFSSSANFSLQSLNAAYPEGNNLSLGGVPFNIPVGGNNIWASGAVTGANPRTLDIPLSVFGVTEVHTLINTFWGQAGPDSYASLEFFGSGGAYYKKDLIGNIDIRDFNQNAWTNSINGTTSVEVVGGPFRLDKQAIVLPSIFQTQTLTQIRLSDNGGFIFQRTFLAGVTVQSPESIPEPSSTLGLIALGVLGLGTTLKRKL